MTSTLELQLARAHQARISKFFPGRGKPQSIAVKTKPQQFDKPVIEAIDSRAALICKQLHPKYLQPVRFNPTWVFIHDIVRFVALRMDVRVAEILGPQRTRRPVFARQIAQHLSCLICRKSLPQIGRAMGRDRTTVLHANRKIAAMRQCDPGFDRLLTDWECFLRFHGE
jgi:hypothetical protein